MRGLKIDSTRKKQYNIPSLISVIDAQGIGNEYYIDNIETDNPVGEYGKIKFQNSPIKEGGINGCQSEDLIATAIDHLRGLDSSLPCEENGLAIIKLYEALYWLNKRTADRIDRGVEGTNQA